MKKTRQQQGMSNLFAFVLTSGQEHVLNILIGFPFVTSTFVIGEPSFLVIAQVVSSDAHGEILFFVEA